MIFKLKLNCNFTNSLFACDYGGKTSNIVIYIFEIFFQFNIIVLVVFWHIRFYAICSAEILKHIYSKIYPLDNAWPLLDYFGQPRLIPNDSVLFYLAFLFCRS